MVTGAVCVITFLIVLLIYSTRIYTNRTVLAGIPKGYLPIEDGEIGKGVRVLILKHLRRSAVIAWDSRPRDFRGEAGHTEEDAGTDDGLTRQNTAESRWEKHKEEKARKKKAHAHETETTIIHIDAKSPPWGHVAHPGWASPASPDLPNLQYWNVICELPNLIEAKAVSLAPADPVVEGNLQYPDNAPPLPDAQIVTLLQRPRAMGLRDYLARLAEFGLLNPPHLGPAFLAQYEYARFSCDSLTEVDFRHIMAVFADILNGMTELDSEVVEEARAQSIYSDNRSLAPTESSSDTSTSSQSHGPYRTPQLHRQRSVSSYSDSNSLSSSNESPHSPQTLRTAPSRQRQRNTPSLRTPSERSLRSMSGTSQRSGQESDTGSVMIHPVQRSQSTLLSISSSNSLGSGSERSVIRLHPSPSLGQLPYQYLHQIDGG